MGIRFVALLRVLRLCAPFSENYTYLLRCVVMCCGVLRRVVMCCDVLRCVAVWGYLRFCTLSKNKNAQKRTDSRDCEILSIRSFYIVL